MHTALAIHKIKLKKIKYNYELKMNNTTRNLRNILSYRPVFFKSNRCKNSLQSNGINLYNSLPNDIKNEPNIKIFKNKLNKYLLTNTN